MLKSPIKKQFIDAKLKEADLKIASRVIENLRILQF